MDHRLGCRRDQRRWPAAALIIATVLAAPGFAQQPGLSELPPPGYTTSNQITDYLEAVGSVLPLTPELIKDFNARVTAGRQAASWRPYPAGIGSDADLISLEPGQPSPVVRLAPGVASVVTFADATGQAWPVAGYVVGDQAGFEVRHPGGVDGQQGPSHLTMAPLIEAGWTNLVVELAGEPIPVILSLIVDPEAPHYRLDVQVLALGPNATSGARQRGRTPPSAGTSDLARFIAAVDLPAESAEVAVENVDGTRVWLMPSLEGEQGEMVVRTTHSLLGPDWTEVMNGPGGIRVYRMRTVNSLLFAAGGGTVIARVARP